MLWKSLSLTIVVCLSLAIFATDAFAQPVGRGRGRSAQSGGRFGNGQTNYPLFAELDANSDGAITRQEMEDAVRAFAKLDKDNDGKLTAQEAGGSSQSPAAGRGGRGGRRGGEGVPGAGRGGRGRQGQGAGRGATQPTAPPAGEGRSKSPFDD